jgi:hypothetical protein
LILQFLVVLSETDPLVWRRIQVPESYSFWDLHVAIQDAMGWQDYHLHEFTLVRDTGRVRRIGIPDDEMPHERPTEAGWKVAVSKALGDRPLPMRYVYDFGDNWEHVVIHEGTWSADPALKYPRCIGGARACPPEDCGGPSGYTEFLAAVLDRRHPEHRAMVEWSGGRFDADAFNPAAVGFDDPQERWKRAFEED